MIFNPLFISGTSTPNEAGKSKLNNPSFLFSDIINVRHKVKGLGMDESTPSFNSFLGSVGNSTDYLISSTSSGETGLKGYKLNEKEIGGVLSEILKNSDSVEIFSNGKLIYKNEDPGDNVYSILQKLLAELENGGDIELSLKSGDSKYSVELKGLNSDNIHNSITGVIKETGKVELNEALDNSDEEYDDLTGLFALLQDPRIFEKIENDLPADSVEALKYLTSDPDDYKKFESFISGNPLLLDKVKETINSNKQLVLGVMNDIIKSSSSFNLNPEEINKLDQIAAYVLENKQERLPELIKFINDNIVSESGTENKGEYTFAAKIEKLFAGDGNSTQIAAEIISGLNNDTIKSLIEMYQDNPESRDLLVSANQHTTGEVKALLDKGILDLKQLLPELKGFLGSFDNKELVNTLLSDEKTAGIIKERVTGLLSKVESATAAAEIDITTVEKELFATLKTSGKEFSDKLDEIVKQFDLKANSEILSKSETLKPIIEAVLAKLGKNDSHVKKAFEKIAGSNDTDIKSVSKIQNSNSGVNSTLENFLKIVASKSAETAIDSGENISKPEAESNKEFMLKISNMDIPEKEINQLTKLITREDVSVRSGEKNLAKYLEKNLVKSDDSHDDDKSLKSDRSTSGEKVVFKDKYADNAVSKNANDFRQIEKFIKSVTMKRSLAEAEIHSNKIENAKVSGVVEQVLKPETPVIEKNISEQHKPEMAKTTSESDFIKSNEEASVQSDSGKGFDGNKGSESHKGTATASGNSIKQAPGVDKSFETQLKATANNADIQRRIKVIKDVELSRVNTELRNIVSSKSSQNVTLRLNPAMLGEIDVAIEIIKNTVKASIEVENDSVKQVVNSGIEQLKQALVQQGLQPQSINVSLSTPEDRNNKFARNKKKNSGPEKFDLENEIEVEAPKNMGYNTYDYVA